MLGNRQKTRTCETVVVGIFLAFIAFTPRPALSSGGVQFNWQNNAYNQPAATSATLSKGGNKIATNDFLIAVVCVENSTTDPGDIAPPDGWTQQAGGWVKPNDGGGVRCGFYTKLAGNSESGSYSFSWTHANVHSWALFDYTNGGSAASIDGSVGNTQHSSGYTKSLVAPSISPTSGSAVLLSFWAAPISGTITCAAGCTTTIRLKQPGTTTSAPWIGQGDLKLTSTGAAPTQTLTYQYSLGGYEAVSIALKP